MTQAPYIAWWELVGRDLQAAQSAYAALGWRLRELGVRRRYPLWSREGHGRAGWAQLPDEAAAAGAPAHWMPCAWVSDAAALLQRVAPLAGQVVLAPTRVAHLGALSTLVDPQGAALTLLEPTRRMRRWLRPPGGPLPLLWAADPQALAPFYHQLLGWQVVGERGRSLLLGVGEQLCVELAPRPPGAPPLWLPRWPAADLADARAGWRAAGGSVEGDVLLDRDGVASLGAAARAPG